MKPVGGTDVERETQEDDRMAPDSDVKMTSAQPRKKPRASSKGVPSRSSDPSASLVVAADGILGEEEVELGASDDPRKEVNRGGHRPKREKSHTVDSTTSLAPVEAVGVGRGRNNPANTVIDDDVLPVNDGRGNPAGNNKLDSPAVPKLHHAIVSGSSNSRKWNPVVEGNHSGRCRVEPAAGARREEATDFN